MEITIGTTKASWTVIDGPTRVKGRKMWLCQCVCGTEQYLAPSKIRDPFRVKRCKACAAEEARDRNTRSYARRH